MIWLIILLVLALWTALGSLLWIVALITAWRFNCYEVSDVAGGLAALWTSITILPVWVVYDLVTRAQIKALSRKAGEK